MEAVTIPVFVVLYKLVGVPDTETEDESEMVCVTDTLAVKVAEDGLLVLLRVTRWSRYQWTGRCGW